MPTGYRVESKRGPKPTLWVRPKDAWQGQTLRTWDGYEFEVLPIPETRWDGKASTLTQDQGLRKGRQV